MARLRNRDFLRRVACRAAGPGGSPKPLPVASDLAVECFGPACTGLTLRLVAIEPGDDGYVFAPTQAGLYLLDGHLDDAAAALHLGLVRPRLHLMPNAALMRTRLAPTGPGVAIARPPSREVAVAVMLAVAAGHAYVESGRVLAHAVTPVRSLPAPARARAWQPARPDPAPIGGLLSMRGAGGREAPRKALGRPRPR